MYPEKWKGKIALEAGKKEDTIFLKEVQILYDNGKKTRKINI